MSFEEAFNELNSTNKIARKTTLGFSYIRKVDGHLIEFFRAGSTNKGLKYVPTDCDIKSRDWIVLRNGVWSSKV